MIIIYTQMLFFSSLHAPAKKTGWSPFTPSSILLHSAHGVQKMLLARNFHSLKETRNGGEGGGGKEKNE